MKAKEIGKFGIRLLNSIGCGAIWAAGATAALRTTYHPIIKGVYVIGSATAGLVLGQMTDRWLVENLDRLLPDA